MWAFSVFQLHMLAKALVDLGLMAAAFRRQTETSLLAYHSPFSSPLFFAFMRVFDVSPQQTISLLFVGAGGGKWSASKMVSFWGWGGNGVEMGEFSGDDLTLMLAIQFFFLSRIIKSGSFPSQVLLGL